MEQLEFAVMIVLGFSVVACMLKGGADLIGWLVERVKWFVREVRVGYKGK
jgi:hypothetical protein